MADAFRAGLRPPVPGGHVVGRRHQSWSIAGFARTASGVSFPVGSPVGGRPESTRETAEGGVGVTSRCSTFCWRKTARGFIGECRNFCCFDGIYDRSRQPRVHAEERSGPAACRIDPERAHQGPSTPPPPAFRDETDERRRAGTGFFDWFLRTTDARSSDFLRAVKSEEGARSRTCRTPCCLPSLRSLLGRAELRGDGKRYDRAHLPAHIGRQGLLNGRSLPGLASRTLAGFKSVGDVEAFIEAFSPISKYSSGIPEFGSPRVPGLRLSIEAALPGRRPPARRHGVEFRDGAGVAWAP